MQNADHLASDLTGRLQQQPPNRVLPGQQSSAVSWLPRRTARLTE